MADALLLLLAWISSLVGTAWLALAMNAHWRQIRSGEPPARRLRCLGAAASLLSLWLCLAADHASMAVLVWVMALTGSALTVAFTLSWRPAALAPLVAWARQPG